MRAEASAVFVYPGITREELKFLSQDCMALLYYNPYTCLGLWAEQLG
jgi:hypothetical protein